MSVIKLKSKTKKPQLKVDYEGTTYTLPGHVNATMVEALLKPKNDDGTERLLVTFLETVVPKDFKSVLAEPDLGELLNLWLGHINGPKESGSKS